MKKAINKSKKYLVTIISFAVILVACIGATIGITMAYFGDVKSGTANITLGAGILINGESLTMTTDLTDGTVAVPSQTVTVSTSIVVKKGTGDKATDAVLQIAPTFDAGTTGITCNFNDGEKFAVTGVDGATLIAKDNYLYLVDSTNTANLKAFTPTADGVTISFSIKIAIPESIDNDVAGGSIQLSLTAKALQSTIYTNDGLVTLTTTNAATYFSAIGA